MPVMQISTPMESTTGVVDSLFQRNYGGINADDDSMKMKLISSDSKVCFNKQSLF